MKNFNILLFLLICNILWGQQDLELISQVSFEEESNDIWGYVDEDGIEYAIIGTVEATRIFSLSNPAEPIEIASIPGARSIWRDIKTIGQYIYVVADQGADGLLIIDMTNAPEEVTHQFYRPTIRETPTLVLDSIAIVDTMVLGESTTFDTSYMQFTRDTIIETELRKCHNLYANDLGYIYLAGCNEGCSGSDVSGVLIFDANEDPFQPKLIGRVDQTYSHDVYVNGDFLYASQISCGFGSLGIFDISDRRSPKLLAQVPTGLRFTHNAWSNDDNTVVFTTDERPNARVEAYDISDINNVEFLDAFVPLETVGNNVVPHNTHFHEGFLYTSYYTDGLVITDANRPDNLIQVGQFDSWQGPDGGFEGNWGAYPFLPSGLILISDISSGLFVLNPDIKRACYIEGTVSDDLTGEVLNGVSITIKSDDLNGVVSDGLGRYKTGQATSGSFIVSYKKLGYFTQDVEIELVNGEVILQDVQLVKKRIFSITGTTKKALDASFLNNVSVILTNDEITYRLNSNGEGNLNPTEILEGEYLLVAGNWGYKEIVIESLVVDESKDLDLQLELGYEDNFAVDQGWQVNSTSPTGNWELDVPFATFEGGKKSNVDFDIEGDNGFSCYITGNLQGSPGLDDVDDGNTILTSPFCELSTYDQPILNYQRWFYNGGGFPDDVANDEMIISVTNQIDTSIIEMITDSFKRSGEWVKVENIVLEDFISINDSIQFIISISDNDPGHLVEGGFDGFSVTDGIISSTPDFEEKNNFTLFPNPGSTELYLKFTEERIQNIQLQIYDQVGKLVIDNPQFDNGSIDISSLSTGIYFINLVDRLSGIRQSQKFIKHY